MSILSAHARIDDETAMRKLLEPLPPAIAADVRQVASPEGRGKAGMRYDAPSRKAFWIEHTKDSVVHVPTPSARSTAYRLQS